MSKVLPRVNKHRSVKQWHAIVEQYHSQPLSVEAYCKELGIGTSSFYKWRNKLNLGDNSPVPLFIPVQTVPERTKVITQWDIELELGDGMILRISKPC